MADARGLPTGETYEIALTLDDLAREGARRMIAAALEAEMQKYVASFADDLDEDGKRLVVRNGPARERKVTHARVGHVPVRAPRVNDKRLERDTGERQRFTSTILPPYACRSPKVNDELPVLYLSGLSTGKPVASSVVEVLDLSAHRDPGGVGPAETDELYVAARSAADRGSRE